jgi:hypothetical protein
MTFGIGVAILSTRLGILRSKNSVNCELYIESLICLITSASRREMSPLGRSHAFTLEIELRDEPMSQ